jgi:hypothetical protein
MKPVIGRVEWIASGCLKTVISSAMFLVISFSFALPTALSQRQESERSFLERHSTSAHRAYEPPHPPYKLTIPLHTPQNPRLPINPDLNIVYLRVTSFFPLSQ